MGLKYWDIIATLILNLIHCAYTAEHILSCNVTSLEPCPDHQICIQASNSCECEEGLVWAGKQCSAPERGDGGGNATATVVAVFTLALVAGGLVLVVRKYNLVQYVRQKINQRRGNDVMYEDVMIGQDDPPLSL